MQNNKKSEIWIGKLNRLSLENERKNQSFPLYVNWKRQAIFELPRASVSKRGPVQNLSYENKFDLYGDEPVGEMCFRMNCFPRRRHFTQVKGNSEMAIENPFVFSLRYHREPSAFPLFPSTVPESPRTA